MIECNSAPLGNKRTCIQRCINGKSYLYLIYGGIAKIHQNAFL
jgi:hypothetical protein